MMKCPNCHGDIVEGARFCQACGVAISQPVYPVAASSRAKRKPWVGALLSAIVPGLGHLYSGQAKRGINLWLITVFVSLLASILALFGALIGLLVGLLARFCIWLYILIDAIKLAKRTIPYDLKWYNQWYIYAGIIALFWMIDLGSRTFVVQAYRIPASSMIPTLEIGDHILVNKLSYGLRVPFLKHYLLEYDKPDRGDVVVFIFPEDRSKDFVKRVIGVTGDTVEIRAKKVYINGKEVDDPHARFAGYDPQGVPMDGDNYGSKVVPKNHIFVMGDNRDRSYDSRFWGYVNLNDVRGKAFLIYWSWDSTNRSVRWERIGSTIR